MNHSKAMGLGAMLLLLVGAVVLLPIIVRFIDKMEPQYVSGFEDFAVPSIAQNSPSTTSFATPDPNTNFLCSVDGSGNTCPEGTFCNGCTKSCVKTYRGGPVPDTGYFS